MIRCPNCGKDQSPSRAVCANCGASLIEIVVAYPHRLALALDREQLEADGWKLGEVKEEDGGSRITATFRREPGAAQTRRPRPATPTRSEPKSAFRPLALVSVVILALLIGALIVATLRARSSNGAETSAAPQLATPILGIEGPAGVIFAGTITTDSNVQKIQGQVPQTFDLEARSDYTVVIQKQGTDLALLRVTITCKNGTTLSSSTAAPSGVLTISGHCE